MSKDEDDMLPLHYLAWNLSVTAEALTALLKANPEAATSKDNYGWLPLHSLAKNESATAELLAARLEAQKAELRENQPRHVISSNLALALPRAHRCIVCGANVVTGTCA